MASPLLCVFCCDFGDATWCCECDVLLRVESCRRKPGRLDGLLVGVRSQKVSGTNRNSSKRLRTVTKEVVLCHGQSLSPSQGQNSIASIITYKKTQRQPNRPMIAALTSGIRFLPPSSSSVYMPMRYALSCKKKISAIVADGRHSTGLNDIP